MLRSIACVSFLLTMLLTSSAYAVPRMSLLAGTPCDACHINGQGGGMRTEIGWGTGAFTGAVMYDQIGLDSVAETESNFYFDGLLGAGVDIRGQVTRSTPTTEELPPHIFIPMQIQPYLAVVPTEWLTIYGTYNVGPSTFDGELCNPRYPGQSCYAAAARIRPDPSLPTLKIGHFQPNIGVRHDDHTMWIRRDASQKNPLIAPNYAEYGGEVSYQPVYWFRADAGAYLPQNLEKSLQASGAAPGSFAYLGRAQFLPQLEDLGVVSWFGASLFGSGPFLMQNYFLGVGKKDLANVMVEASFSDRGDGLDHTTFNLMTYASWQITEWLTLEGRYERATASKQGDEFLTQAGVLGLQFFPIPFVELRPEYRLTFSDDVSFGQFAIQLHLFY